jgi:hypothetical protein
MLFQKYGKAILLQHNYKKMIIPDSLSSLDVENEYLLFGAIRSYHDDRNDDLYVYKIVLMN